MKKNYSFLLLIFTAFLSVMTVYGQKSIMFIGRSQAALLTEYQSDADLIDSLTAWGFEVTYMFNDDYGAGVDVSVFDGMDGCFINETVDSKAMNDFGTIHEYPVPVVCLEGYVVSNSNDRWAWITDGAEIYQTADAGGTEDDRVLVIKDNSHYITQGFDNNQEVQWSTVESATGLSDTRPVSIIESEVSFSSTLAIIKSHADQAGYWNLLTVDEIGSKNNKVVFWGLNHIGLNGSDQHQSLGTPEFFTIAKRASEWAFDAMEGPEAVKAVDQDKYKLALYPNPAVEGVTIQFRADNGQNAVVSLHTITGAQVNNVFHKTTVEGRNHIAVRLDDYPQGIYIVKLQVENDVVYQKLIIE